jgi:hypothetical protein
MSGAGRQIEAAEQGGAASGWTRRAIVAVVVSAVAGCSSSAPPPTKPSPPTTAETASSPAAVAQTPPADNTPAGDAAPAGESASVPATDQVDKPQDAVAKDDGAAPDDHAEEDIGTQERFALLTPGGPLIVEVAISVDGKTLAEAGDAAAAAATREDAEEGDGENAGSEDASEGAIAEGDGEASEDERVARYFRIRSSRSYSPDPRRTSLLWPLLDADGDGQLDEREIASAADRLWSRDADDDRVIRPAEVASLREQLDGSAATAMGRRSASGPAASRLAALPLGPDCNMDRVDFVFQDLYAPQQDLSPGSFSDLPRLFRALDANGDQWIERDELANVQSVGPHLRLVVAYTSNGENSDNKAPKQARLEIREATDEVQQLDSGASDRTLLALGETRVLISAHDMSGAPNPLPQPAPMQGAEGPPVGVRVMVHDRGDAIFEALDANADGVLGEREVAGAQALLAARDASGDGRLTVDETPYQMIVAFLYGEAPGGPSYFAPPAPPRPADEAPPAAWFVAADLNGDGDVSRREFLGDAETFAKLDANADGYVDAREAAPVDANPAAAAAGDSATPIANSAAPASGP